MENPYIVYVKTNDSGCITAVNSSAFLEDVTGWTEIDRGYGDKYHHAQSNYFPKPIKAMGGAYYYRLVDGKVQELSDSELLDQVKNEAAIDLSLEERLSALERVTPISTYTAGKWYYRGDKVSFDGKVYTCIAPGGVACVWSPSEYPIYWVC